jgi:hypothetical protein
MAHAIQAAQAILISSVLGIIYIGMIPAETRKKQLNIASTDVQIILAIIIMRA